MDKLYAILVFFAIVGTILLLMYKFNYKTPKV